MSNKVTTLEVRGKHQKGGMSRFFREHGDGQPDF